MTQQSNSVVKDRLVLNFDKASHVLVTGATGYVAGWIVKRLLEEGVTVHAAVCDPDDAAKRAHLDRVAWELPGSLRYFKAGPFDHQGYAQAMEGCSIVFHTKVPFKFDVADPQAELIDPVMSETRSVLEVATQTASVRRVVLTSSCTAICGDNIDIRELSGHVLTEQVWNTSSTLEHNYCAYAQTLVERAAWEMVRSQPRWDLVTINPSLIMGPGLDPWGASEGFNLIRQLGNGQLKGGVPDIGYGVADVRDVAEAHLRAAYRLHAKGRYIVSGSNTSLFGVARVLVPRYGAYPVPRRILPKWFSVLARTFGDEQMTRKYLSRNVGYAWRADSGKSRRDLNMSYRPLVETVQDMFQQMIDTDQLPSH